MTKGIFVTGTDTGVGKTVVSALIIAALKRQGIKVGAMKPVETGCERRGNVLLPADGLFLRTVSSMSDPLELITPVRYELPLAPFVAESEEGMTLDLHNVFDAYKALSSKYEFMVVEGVGGVMVPLTRRNGSFGSAYFVADLIADLGLQAVVVGRPVLGTINHILVTVSCLLARGIRVAGVIISYGSPPDGSVAERTNPQALKDLCPVPIIGTIPHISDVSPEAVWNLDVFIDIETLKQ
ncbi:MAG TPA: dethiobiotin synthase [Dissulfurispiraceae bacterium]|nr:dethiobiotin synthase [Dissulfurispiraceae bacterium]